MDGEDRTATHPLERYRLLRTAPYRVRFYQAMRLLECAHADRPRFGQSQHSKEDAVRLAQEPSMAFAPSSIAGFEPRKGDRLPRLSVLLFGLFGPNGPLPLHLTEYARDRLRNSDDASFSRFVDMFHHRMIGLFYRAWANGQPAVSFDRPDTDRFSYYVGSLFGLGQSAVRDGDALPDVVKLHYAGILAEQTRPAAGLRSMLASFFRVPVVVQEFVGHWVELPGQCRWRLGESPEIGSLGMSTTVGARVWDARSKFRIEFGPLGYEDYCRLLPGGQSLRRLVALVRNYIGFEFDWDVRLILKRDQVSRTQLGGAERLGRTTWLLGRSPQRDGDDLVLDPSAQTA